MKIQTDTNGYITCITKESNVDAEYDNFINTVFSNKPQVPDGFDYKLCQDLTWELVESEYIPQESDYATAAKILMGEISG